MEFAFTLRGILVGYIMPVSNFSMSNMIYTNI